MSEYKCNKCGKIFPEEEIIRESEYDIGDNLTTTKFLSPCCFANFRDEW